jgi:hypothetical protein
VVQIVAFVSISNLGSTLIENVGKRIPVVGTLLDNVVQGAAAGFLTLAAGRAAIRRCEAFRGWDPQPDSARLTIEVRKAWREIALTFKSEVLGHLRQRFQSVAGPEDLANREAWWARVSAGIEEAIEATSDGMDNYLIRPTVAAGSAMAAASGRVGRRLQWGWHRSVDATRAVVRRTRERRANRKAHSVGLEASSHATISRFLRSTVAAGSAVATGSSVVGRGVQRGWRRSVDVAKGVVRNRRERRVKREIDPEVHEHRDDSRCASREVADDGTHESEPLAPSAPHTRTNSQAPPARTVGGGGKPPDAHRHR